jgi:hypothetical protein
MDMVSEQLDVISQFVTKHLWYYKQCYRNTWIQKGQKIKVQGIEDGFYGAWFLATVLKTFSEKMFD